MEKDIKFIIGGILIVLSIITGNWFFSTLIDSTASLWERIAPPLIFLIILLVGLGLLADALVRK